MALLLSLFSDQEMSGVGSSPLPSSSVVSSVPSEACSPESAGILDPCVRCPLAGVCSPDDCAQHGFPLDLPFPPTRFRNLGEYINLLKHYGWA